jgi:hypothetical protein
MANAWVMAGRIRDFLGALEARLPVDGRTEGTCAWLAWAHQHAATIDPLREPETVARPQSNQDRLYLEDSRNGGTWAQLASYSGNIGWAQRSQSITLPARAPPPYGFASV